MSASRIERIGVVGTENSHTELVLGYLNADERQPGRRLTHVLANTPERDAALRAIEPDLVVVPDLDALAAEVDAVVVCDRDGGLHPEHAAPFLRAGMPVFVDKPLATSVAGVERITGDARAGGTVVVSHSPIRFTAGWQRMARWCRGRGLPRHLRLTGPADPDSEWGGLFFYGIHLADAACSLLGRDPGRPVVRQSPDRIEVTSQIGRTTLELVFTSHDGPARFRAEAGWDERGLRPLHELVRLELDPNYLRPGLDHFFAVADGRQQPQSESEHRRPVDLLEQIQQAVTRTDNALTIRGS